MNVHNQNYFVLENINVLLKIKIMDINRSNSHNYHDEIELCQGISKRKT